MKKLWWIAKDKVRWAWRGFWSRTIGMRLAEYLDKKHPDWCWATLCVNLGLGWDIRHWDECKSTGVCKSDVERNGTCWCGKMYTPEFHTKYQSGKELPIFDEPVGAGMEAARKD